MESLQHIKSRLTAVKNIGTITKAMEVVSATKMRKAQLVALDTRPYAFHSLRLLQKLISDSEISSPLMQTSNEKSAPLVLVIASDRGLAGSFNAQVMKRADTLFTEPGTMGAAVGKKAVQYLEKKGMKPVARYTGFGDIVEYDGVLPLADFIIGGFLRGEWSRVDVVSPHFRSTLKQDTLVRTLLPISVDGAKRILEEVLPEHGRFSDLKKDISEHSGMDTEYILEPSRHEVVASLVPHLVRVHIYDLILEANASEHSARMVAMKAASDNAGELSESLVLSANKARQASITKEMIEIISTQNALS